jgi:hypothetical protein
MQNKETEKTASAHRQKSPLLLIVISTFIVFTLIADFLFIQKKAEYADYKNIKVGSENLRLEVADTAAKREKGLSGRQSIGSNKGMLFDFKQSGDWGIWMKDMNFNIDIAWLVKEGKIVHILANVSPASYPEIFRSEKESWYVIEVPASTFGRLNVKEGSSISIK